jgi:hypothetical protein
MVAYRLVSRNGNVKSPTCQAGNHAITQEAALKRRLFTEPSNLMIS